MQVRPERAGDREAIRAVHDQAFGGPLEGVLVDRIRDAPGWLSNLSLVAEDGDRVVGHALLSRIEVGPPGHALAALSLAPVGVLPEWQGRGVGSALCRAGLEAARAAGEDLVVVLGEPAYYARFGFAPAHLQEVTSPWPEVGDALQTLALSPAGAAASGPARYPPAFDPF